MDTMGVDAIDTRCCMISANGWRLDFILLRQEGSIHDREI